MKLLIIGASGLVGSNILSVAKSLGHEVVGTYHTYPVSGLRPLNLSDLPAFQEIMSQESPDAVVCAAAWVWADGCQRNPRRALAFNRDYPAEMAEITRRFGAQFVFLSTNYVFNGLGGPYDEEAPTDPINIYGRSKLSAETEILETMRGEAIIIRTAGIYGEEEQKKNFVCQVIRNLRSGNIMKVPNDQFHNATYAEDLAAGIVRLLEKQKTGIWNLAGPDPQLCRSDFALRIAQEYDLDSSLLDCVPTVALGQLALRPRMAGLIIDKARQEIGFDPTEWTKVII